MLNTDNQQNPVVYAKFKGSPATSEERKKILFYGHCKCNPGINEVNEGADPI
jgi:di- and tripeptidase